MMKKFNFLLASFMLFVMSSSLVNAQNSDNPWYISFGAHAVDHTSVRGIAAGFFDIDDYSIVPPLSKITIGRNLNNSFAVDLTGSFGEVDNNRLGIEDEFFINLGLGLKYRFTNGYILKQNSWFDPYLRVGANYHHYDYDGVNISPTNPLLVTTAGGADDFLAQEVQGEDHNFGVAGGAGFNIWFTKNFGLNVASDYNWIPESQTDYFDFFQHTVGVAFRFGGNNDKDEDGILDDEDDCPETPGVASSVEGCNGCPDSDGDGLCDAKDECPNEAGPISNNGCPEKKEEPKPEPTDKDGDGIYDKDDDCPDTPGVASSKPGCNGCPDKDGDGICDSQDPCPENPVNDCIVKGVTEIENVNFVYNKTEIVETSQSDLTKAVNIMQKVPASCFKVGGHTDSKGSSKYNQNLSERRATAIVDYISAKGINANRLKAVGYGEEYPIRPNDTDAGRAANRRVEFTYSDCNTWEPKAIGLSDADTTQELNRLAKKIYFATGSANLVETSQLNLEIIAKYLIASKKNWEVAGHTDNVGNDANNLRLSQNRAQSVVDYLVGKGVPASKLTAKGYGETSPVDTNDTKSGRANNRRIEFK